MLTTNLVMSPSTSLRRALKGKISLGQYCGNIPVDHLGSLVDVGDSVEKTLNTCDSLSQY